MTSEVLAARRWRLGIPVALAIWVPVAVIVIYALAAIFGPLIVGYDPNFIDTGNRLLPPMSSLPDGGFALLGTDQVGQDILAQVLQGARISMIER